jgi:hypothetical protein
LLRVDRAHPLAAKLDALLGDVLVAQLDLGRRLPAEEDVQLGEAKGEGLVLVDERRTDVGPERLGEARRQLQSREACAEDHDVRHAEDDNAGRPGVIRRVQLPGASREPA